MIPLKPSFICCKVGEQCLCIDQRFAIPCDKDVPLEVACCSKYCVEKTGDRSPRVSPSTRSRRRRRANATMSLLPGKNKRAQQGPDPSSWLSFIAGGSEAPKTQALGSK